MGANFYVNARFVNLSFKYTVPNIRVSEQSGPRVAKLPFDEVSEVAMAECAEALDPIFQERLDAARAGRPDALYDLGLIYSLGRGVEPDLIEAHKWLNLAAMRGVKEAQQCRAELAAEMSPWEIAAAQRMAREWLSSTH